MGEPTSILSAGSVLNGIGTNLIAGGNPITGAMLNASALAGSQGFGSGGGSLFGFETPFSGIGRAIDPITSAIGNANTWMNQNPITSRVGMELAQSLLSPEQQRMASAGASVRPGGQIQPADYMSLLNPQQQTVIRPATPSLI